MPRGLWLYNAPEASAALQRSGRVSDRAGLSRLDRAERIGPDGAVRELLDQAPSNALSRGLPLGTVMDSRYSVARSVVAWGEEPIFRHLRPASDRESIEAILERATVGAGVPGMRG